MASPAHRSFVCSLALRILLVLLVGLDVVEAQFPRAVANLTTVPSPAGEGVTISYREPEPWACRTAFGTQRQVTGWVSVPGPYPTNLFFWFVAARENKTTTPFTVWLNGGPGSSSLLGLFTGNGPCSVAETGLGAFETTARQWGWDRASHVLFIDQPNQVGFSYDVPTQGTLSIANGTVASPPLGTSKEEKSSKGKGQGLLLNGTFPSFDVNSMPNTTETAADAVWHLLQAFLGIFPEYVPVPGNSSASSDIGVNLFAESYGGTYGPVFASSWQERNAQVGKAAPAGVVPVKLKSLGIVNGCVDPLTEALYYPYMASNNTYGLEVLSPREVQLAIDKYHAVGGCADLVAQCQDAVKKRGNDTIAAGLDPDYSDLGTTDADINTLCNSALGKCIDGQQTPYFQAGRSAYDLSHPLHDPVPSNIFQEYLNTAALQTAVGAVTNFSASNPVVNLAFSNTADSFRRPLIPKLADLLNNGTRIALVHGDRDYICNWMAGDAVSQAIAVAAGDTYADAFSKAGYAPIAVNNSYIGGVVRQFANLSFTRVYQAGHMPTLSQPETAFQIFARIVLGTSLSTGQAIDLSSYSTPGDPKDKGQSSQSLPSMPKATCWLRSLNDTCDDGQRSMVLAGEGVTINGALYSKSADWPLYDASTASDTTSSATGGAEETATVVMTGVFVATAIPDSGDEEDAAVGRCVGGEHVGLMALGVVLSLFVLGG